MYKLARFQEYMTLPFAPVDEEKSEVRLINEIYFISTKIKNLKMCSAGYLLLKHWAKFRLEGPCLI